MKEMTLIEHLTELRSRLVWIAIILVVSLVVSYTFADSISEILLSPLKAALAGKNAGKVVYLGLLDKVLSQFQVALWTGILLSCPLWFHQIWLFIRPGLYPHEVKVVRPFLLIGLFLFITGVIFGYFIVFPATFSTFMDFGVSNVEATISLKEYLILVSKVLVFLGLLFQIPNVLLILGFMELVTKYSLARWRKNLYFMFALISAFLTPPDIVTMMALWVPFVLLFEVGVVAVAVFVHPYLLRRYS